ncbi:MAG: dihydroorotase [Gammaproteobacteria bacterium]
MVEKISISMPDDMHLHIRDGAEMAHVLPHTVRQFARAIIMPNLQPPVLTVQQALSYKDAITALLPADTAFQPLMTLYLTDNTPQSEVQQVAQSPAVHAFKYYPAGATTNSENGVTAVNKIYPVLEAMQKHDIPLLVHGEATAPDTDVFDRETIFIDQVLADLTQRFPELRIVFEHITTADAVDFVSQSPGRIAATITPHHLLLNRNALFDDGIRPHHYCLPILKAERHRQALLAAATGGDSRFFLGTDSAPHSVSAKQNACGCAGIYSAYTAMEIYAELFYQAGQLDRLQAFAAHHGADFYQLPRNKAQLDLTREPWQIPQTLPYTDGGLVPLLAGETCHWKLSAR